MPQALASHYLSVASITSIDQDILLMTETMTEKGLGGHTIETPQSSLCVNGVRGTVPKLAVGRLWKWAPERRFWGGKEHLT